MTAILKDIYFYRMYIFFQLLSLKEHRSKQQQLNGRKSSGTNIQNDGEREYTVKIPFIHSMAMKKLCIVHTVFFPLHHKFTKSVGLLTIQSNSSPLMTSFCIVIYVGPFSTTFSLLFHHPLTIHFSFFLPFTPPFKWYCSLANNSKCTGVYYMFVVALLSLSTAFSSLR